MKPVELPAPNFTDGRGLYPERLAVSVPRGLTEAAKRAAVTEGVTLAEFVRRAVAGRLSAAQDRTAFVEQLHARALGETDPAVIKRALANAAAVHRTDFPELGRKEGEADGE